MCFSGSGLKSEALHMSLLKQFDFDGEVVDQRTHTQLWWSNVPHVTITILLGFTQICGLVN